LQLQVGGSRLGEYQFKGQAKAPLNLREFNYLATWSLGDKYSAERKGTFWAGGDKIYGYSDILTIKTPFEGFKSVKFPSSVKVVRGDGVSTPCQVRCGR